jgi:pyruvate formate lyase activating enzyme
MKGLIFNIKKYSIHDGPGIRVTFFMKGCPLGCLWCHNPEGISPKPEVVNKINKVGQLEFISKEVAGRSYSPENVIEILEKERVFIDQSGGGVTFSGGEPMLQSEFLLQTLRLCKLKGYHTAVDTSGFASTNDFISIIPFTDIFLFDLKHLDNEEHIRLTGVSNVQILANLSLVLTTGKAVMIRIPVVPGYNDDPVHLERLKIFISGNNTPALKKICLLPYHKTGSSKYKNLKMSYRIGDVLTPSNGKMKELKVFFQETGVNVKIGG